MNPMLLIKWMYTTHLQAVAVYHTLPGFLEVAPSAGSTCNKINFN